MVRVHFNTIVTLIVTSLVTSEPIKENKRNLRKNYDKHMWKQELEDELNDALTVPRSRDNNTVRATSNFENDNDEVIEKLLESVTSSEKYLKKVETIEFRLNRLDIELHEKSNAILKTLGEIKKSLSQQNTEAVFENILTTLRNDLNNIKTMVNDGTHIMRSQQPNGENADVIEKFHGSRLNKLENNVQTIMSGVSSILEIMNVVQKRQHMKVSLKSSDAGSSPSDALNLIADFKRSLQESRNKKCEYSYRPVRIGDRLTSERLDLLRSFYSTAGHSDMPEKQRNIFKIYALQESTLNFRVRKGRYDRSERYPTDCHEIQMQGFNVSGIYKIKPDEMEAFYVLCDLKTTGGGWTVFQNRFDGSQEFYKSFNDYKYGFGNLAAEFWLGLEKMSYLTNQKLYELRIELEAQTGQDAYAGYSVFTVGPEHEGYRISTLGAYFGTAGDSLSYHAGQKFSTMDVDNDEWKDGSCAIEHGGAWWYKECDKSNLNGKYSTKAEEHQGQNIYWVSFMNPTTPITKTRMMIRPLPASSPSRISEPFARKSIDLPKGAKRQRKLPKMSELRADYDINQAQNYYDETKINPFFNPFP